jgi:hypothetical protein
MPAIGDGEGLVMAAAAVLALTPTALCIGLIVWSQRVGARYPVGSRWRRLWILPVASLVVPFVGLGGTMLLLALSFSPSELLASPAESRATVLAQGIANAMNMTVLGIGASFVLLVGSVVAVVVGHLRAPRL